MGKKYKDSLEIFRNGELTLLQKQKPIIGLDIGSTSIKLAYMKKNFIFDKWACETMPSGIINQGRIEAISPLVDIIKKLRKTYKIRTKHCAIYLSSSELIVRELRLPEMNEDQIMENIKQEIISLLPLGHDEYWIDYKILEYLKPEKEKGGLYRILVAAIPKSLVNDYIITMKRAGLKLLYIDVLPSILGKLSKYLMMKGKLDKKNNTCFIDFGAKTTQIIILKDNNYYIHKTINNGGEYLTSLIAMKSNTDNLAAEEYKVNINFFTEEKDAALKQQVTDYFDYLIRDIERTLEFFNRNSHEQVERIFLMGGGSMLEGLAQYISRQLSIEVQLIADVLEEYQEVGAISRHVSALSQAIGVTMREEWRHER